MGLYTPTILGGNSYLSWFYDRGAIKDPAHTGTSKGLSQAINRGPIRKFLPKYADVYVTIRSHGLSAGAWTYYVTAKGVRNGLCPEPPSEDSLFLHPYRQSPSVSVLPPYTVKPIFHQKPGPIGHPTGTKLTKFPGPGSWIMMRHV